MSSVAPAQHRDGIAEGFTKRYGVKRLVYLEVFHEINLAIQREKSLKRLPREWKLNLVERLNPQWDDLMPGLAGEQDFGCPCGSMDPRHKAEDDIGAGAATSNSRPHLYADVQVSDGPK